jgi:hypothetical protein
MSFLTIVLEQDMWIYLLGPFVSLLPRRWRRGLSFYEAVHWKSASIVSGIAESIFALAALMVWYSYSVTTWVSNALDSALSKNAPTGITDHEIGFAALVIWATHPLTWAIAYVGVEGMARLCAAFTDTVLGIFPLYLVEKIYSKIRGQKDPEVLGAPKFAQSHVSSYMETMREKMMTAKLPLVPDELFTERDAAEEFLEIRSCRAKPEWDPPRVVRYGDRYYRLEELKRGSALRPFVYKLRRLSAGVPGRTVLVYSPEELPIIMNT